MTVMVAEGAVQTVSERRIVSRASQQAARRRAQQRSYNLRQTGARQAPPPQQGGRGVTVNAQVGRRSGGDIGVPGGSRYQSVILVEFLIAVGVVAFLPLATGGPPDKKSPSPYTVNDMVQLAALGVVYFILAALSSGTKGRFAAWFGALVLLGLMYKKFASGDLNVALTSIHPSGQGPADQTV